ncbi:DUF3800 domain-containing protein [Pelosinus propionicus]|nr:DUF3800 domain-containing protein [Pelosinus propionicus]
MYMDETGKNILGQTNQVVYMYGGVIIDNTKVYDALSIFKKNFQLAKKSVKDKWTVALRDSGKNEKEISADLSRLLIKYELHSREIFNPTVDFDKRGIIKLNPWKYHAPSEIGDIINKLLEEMSPFIERIYIFKTDKNSITDYLTSNGIAKPKDKHVNNRMVDFIVNQYGERLVSKNKKGVLIPDRLDSDIRECFVTKIKENSFGGRLWSEPVAVESYFNGFTQLVDIILYCYRIIYLHQTDKPAFIAIEQKYNSVISPLIANYDLVDYFKEQK